LFAPGGATVCSATVTDTARTGQSTPTGTVSFTHSGAGSLYGSPCRLSGSGPAASCSVFFASFPLGGQAITASYGGDATHDTSAGSTLVAVVLPESTNGCLVFGHGQLTAANGDQASFLGLAFAKPPVGAQWYRDNGPANPFRLASTSVDAVTCTPDASQASVFGKAKLNGTASVEYRIDIQLTAWEHGKGHLPHNAEQRLRLRRATDPPRRPTHPPRPFRPSPPRRQRQPDPRRRTRRHLIAQGIPWAARRGSPVESLDVPGRDSNPRPSLSMRECSIH
jgi:hypothetical protein